MDAVKVYEEATKKLDNNEITSDEYDRLIQPLKDVRENVKSEWELTDHAYTVYCKHCGYKHNRASQYCPECGFYMINGTKWFVERRTV